MQHISIQGQTMNKDVHACIKANVPTATTGTKRHVAGVGYVYYITNANNIIVAKVHKVNGAYNNGVWVPVHMRVTIA